MIQEDYVSFTTAKLLKEKGFDINTLMVYSQNGNFMPDGAIEDTYQVFYAAPTLQMAMKWLREVHKIDITVDPHEVGHNWMYQFHICQNKNYLFSRDIDIFYETCAEAAIKYCLENLI